MGNEYLEYVDVEFYESRSCIMDMDRYSPLSVDLNSVAFHIFVDVRLGNCVRGCVVWVRRWHRIEVPLPNYRMNR